MKFINTNESVPLSWSHFSIVGAVSKDYINTKFKVDDCVVEKSEVISYGQSRNYDINNGFELIQSFAIVNNKVDSNVINDWLNVSDFYPVGGMKAGYGTFLTALTTIWFSDLLANQEADNFNISWNRSNTVAVLSGISNEGKAYIHCPDASMRMNVHGNETYHSLFRYICSIQLPGVEELALSLSGVKINHSSLDIFNILSNSSSFNVSTKDNVSTISIDGLNNTYIVVDHNDGIARVLVCENGFEFKGVVSELGFFLLSWRFNKEFNW